MITMRSKFNSRCKYCGKPISIGDSISKGEDGWGHPACVTGDIITPEVTMREMQVTKQFGSVVEAESSYYDAFTPVVAEVKVQQREFIPSKYQQAIFDAGANGTGNLVVSATAGSGKTRTIQEFITRYIPKNKSWIYLVFNKRNQTEAQDKFGDMPNGLVSTFHSFCLSNGIKKAYGKNVKIDDKKVYQALAHCMNRDTEKELFPLANKVIGLVKNTLTDYNDFDAMMSMCDHYGIDLNGSAGRIIEATRDAMHITQVNTDIVDFDDMLYMTVKNNLTLPTYDYVLVDETQDLNAVQIAIVLRICKANGRTIAVGDENQCQPTGTLVAVAKQNTRWHTNPIEYVPIEAVTVNDRVVSFDRHGQFFVKTAKVSKVACRPYQGEMIKVSSNGNYTLCTPNHKWLVRWTNKTDGSYITYMMRQGDKFRVGHTQLFKKVGSGVCFGLGIRARVERADEAWVLGIHKNKGEALIHEAYISYRFGIPQTIFFSGYGTTHFTQKVVGQIYKRLGDMTSKATDCLNEHMRDIEYPIYKKSNQQRQGRTTLFVTQACNLMSDYMAVVSLPKDDIVTRKYSAKWNPIKIKRFPYRGYVYSLEVEKYHSYVADGLLTQNSIYGFRGADADAFEKVREALKATALPLSLTYRNAKAIVALVNAELPHIKHECLDDAPEGEVLTIEAQDLQACVKPGDMVICRTNAPLVKPCFQLIQHGIKAVIMGRSIGEELVNLINRISKRLPTDNLEFILAALSEYRMQEVSRLMAQGKESTAQALEDKIDTIYALADGCALLPELIKKAETIFSDDAKGVVFSSAHRAKGLEADSVFILHRELFPHPMCVKSGKEWQLKQETNCLFVALTRAKLKLYFVKEAK